MTLDAWVRRARKLRDHPHPVRFLMSRLLWHSGISRFFIIELPEGQRLRFYPSSISAALWTSQDERNEDVEFLHDVLREGDTYVDCGANVGHLAVVARGIVGPRGSVTAIEANPRVFGYCIGNLQLNEFTDVVAMNTALGDKHGSAHISDRRDDDQNRIGEAGTTVTMSPLDDVIDLPHIDLLKLDVEGYEPAVLRGATRTLASAQVVYCELSASNCARFGFNPVDAERLLLDAGFVFLHPRGGEWHVVREPLYARLAAHELPRTGYNVVAVKPAAMHEIAARLARSGQCVVGH
jgi:FkbM family methyltransferase